MNVENMKENISEFLLKSEHTVPLALSLNLKLQSKNSADFSPALSSLLLMDSELFFGLDKQKIPNNDQQDKTSFAKRVGTITKTWPPICAILLLPSIVTVSMMCAYNEKTKPAVLETGLSMS